MQFENSYAAVADNERGTEWSEGDSGFLTKTTSDVQDTLDWVSAQDWSNEGWLDVVPPTGAERARLGAIGTPALAACVPMKLRLWPSVTCRASRSAGSFYRGGIPMIKTWAMRACPYGVRPAAEPPARPGEERQLPQGRLVCLIFRVPKYARYWTS